MKKINFQAIATTIQKDLRRNDVFHDQDLIASRLHDFTLFRTSPNVFDYMDYYYDHHYPKQVVECGSPTVIVEFDVDAANDEY